jgi:adenylosuccinate lyase
VQQAAAVTWETGEPFRNTLRASAAERGQPLDDARLDQICRPERYLRRLGVVFDRLAKLDPEQGSGAC